MSDGSKIEWTDATWGVVRGCEKVSAGCKHCYAIKVAHRFSGLGRAFEGLTVIGESGPNWTGEARMIPKALSIPLRWRKPRRVFVCSASDLFHKDVPFEYIAAVFGVMAAAPQHTFQVLTKRPERMLEWFKWLGARDGIGPYIRSVRVDGDRTLPDYFRSVMRTVTIRGRTVRSGNDPWIKVFNAAACVGSGPLPNVWLGTSVENQETADERIPLLLQCPAAVRWVSAEPLLGPVIFSAVCPVSDLDWVVVGGESGPGARPCDVKWVYDVVGACQFAGVPVFVKQLGPKPYFEVPIYPDGPLGPSSLRVKHPKGGDMSEWPEALRVREMPAERRGT